MQRPGEVHAKVRLLGKEQWLEGSVNLGCSINSLDM